MRDEFELAQAWDAAMSAKEPEAAAALWVDDAVLTDHRPFGWGTVSGRDGMLELYRSVMAESGRLDVSSELLDQVPGRVLVRQTASFQATPENGGGEAEFVTFIVVTTRDGLLEEASMFEAEAEARAAFG